MNKVFFKTVSRFIINCSLSSPENIVFSNFEELHMSFDGIHFELWEEHNDHKFASCELI